MTKSRNVIAKRHVWSDDDIAWLIALFPENQTTIVAEAIGVRPHVAHEKAKLLGLKKNAEHLAADAHRFDGNYSAASIAARFTKGHQRSIVTRFKKGHQHGIATRFTKGHKRNDTAIVGTERIDSKDGYVQIKVADKGNYALPWRQKHRVVWEEHHGAIPPGHIVTFKDRNRQNCAIDNLELITIEENLRRNSIHNLPPELKHTVQVLGQLKRRINERERKQRDEQPGHAAQPSVRHAGGSA